MATTYGSGSEIIRSATFEDIDSTVQVLIQGVQHHIYTVLCIIVHPTAVQQAGNDFFCDINGYDAKAGTTNRSIILFQYPSMIVAETYVWNNRIIFNGYEPVNFTGPMDNTTKQDAIVDQGSGVAQYVRAYTTHADDACDVSITFLDQNNA